MIGYTSTPDYYNDYIAHFGVKGMKWKNHVYKTLHGKYIGAKFAAKKKLQALDKQYGISRKIKRTKRNAGLALKNAKMRTVNGISTQSLRSEAKYLGTKYKNKAKRGLSTLKTNAKITKGRAKASLNTQGVKSQAKYLGTKAKNSASRAKKKVKKTYNNITKTTHKNLSDRGYSSSRSNGNAMRNDSRYRNTGNLSSRGYASSAKDGSKANDRATSRKISKRKKLTNTSSLRKDSRYRVGMSSKSAMRKDSRYKKSSAMKGDRRYKKHG